MRYIIALVFAIGVVSCGGGGGGSSSPQYFNLGGSVTGLASGATLSLELSVGGMDHQSLAVTTSSFSFTPVSLADVASGATYSVTPTTQPVGQICGITGASGTVSDGSVTSVDVTCTNNPVPKLAVLAGDLGSLGSMDGTGAAALFDNPSAIAADGAGNLYVADTYNSTIRKVSPSGVTTLAGLAGYFGTEDGTGGAARFNGPAGITVEICSEVEGVVKSTRNTSCINCCWAVRCRGIRSRSLSRALDYTVVVRAGEVCWR
jgi:NHL repeat